MIKAAAIDGAKQAEATRARKWQARKGIVCQKERTKKSKDSNKKKTNESKLKAKAKQTTASSEEDESEEEDEEEEESWGVKKSVLMLNHSRLNTARR